MSTTQTSPELRLAQLLGVTSTAFLAGKTFTQSFTTTPAFLLAPAPLLARQWKRMFDSDKLFAPFIVILSGCVFGTSAYREPSVLKGAGRLYAVATALLLSTLPYSQLVLHPLNNRLEAKAADYASSDIDLEIFESNQTVHYLVDQWSLANLGRTAVVAAAASIAGWACIGSM